MAGSAVSWTSLVNNGDDEKYFDDRVVKNYGKEEAFRCCEARHFDPSTSRKEAWFVSILKVRNQEDPHQNLRGGV